MGSGLPRLAKRRGSAGLPLDLGVDRLHWNHHHHLSASREPGDEKYHGSIGVCHSGVDDTLETRIGARSRSKGSRSLPISHLVTETRLLPGRTGSLWECPLVTSGPMIVGRRDSSL